MEFLETLFLHIMNMAITASYVILAILIIRICIRKAPKVFSYGLWAVVGFRLACQVSFSSFLSIFNFIHRNSESSNQGTIRYIPTEVNILQTRVTDYLAVNADIKNNTPLVERVVPVDPLQIIISAITIIWIIGIIGLLIYSIVSCLSLKRRIAKAVLMRDNIYECDTIPSPFVFGLLKPKIYIPFRLSEQELSYILLHEQYHIKRLDNLVKPLSFLLLTIYWFNPLVWVAYYCMNKDMEMSCDEKVIADMGMAVKNDYSMSLLSFAVNHRISVTGPLTFGETNTKSRIKNVLNFKKPKVKLSIFLCLICVLLIVACAANPFNKSRKTKVESNLYTADTQEISDYAKQLYDCKNPYIGNASANGKLMNALGISDEMGSFTIEMETSKPPYVLRMNFDDEVVDRDSFDYKMLYYATLLLVLIDNADEIQWSYPNTEDGQMTQITVYWDEQNLKVMGYEDIKSYGKSAVMVQKLLDKLENNTSDINISSAKNVTDNNDGKSQDEKILTMNDILARKDWNNLSLDYFKAFNNAKLNEFDDENALNSYYTFTLSYGDDTYELQVSYLKADNSIDSILLLKNSDSDAILLLSNDPKYTVNTDVQAFLKKKVNMSKYLTYQLPDSLVDGKYSAVLGVAGGNLFLKDGKMPKGPENAPVEWYAYGGVYKLPYKKMNSNTISYDPAYVSFKDNKLVSGSMWENHTGYIGEPIILDYLAEQAVIMQANHDLYTAAEIGNAQDAGNPIPEEEQTSTMYELYFAREDGNVAYCIFLNAKYYTLEDVKALAKSVQFKENAFK